MFNLFKKQKIDSVIKKVSHDFEKPCIRIVFDENFKNTNCNKNDLLCKSRFGGMPFMCKNAQMPLNAKGQELLFLAQINCKELPKQAQSLCMPSDGLLQFFIGKDNLHGLNFTDQTAQTGFCVRYITQEELLTNANALDVNANAFDGAHFFNFVPCKETISFEDASFEQIFVNAYNALLPSTSIKRLKDLQQDVLERVKNAFLQKRYHKIAGYAYFAQEDPRYKQEYAPFDSVLLQLGSDQIVDFGDGGECAFFIQNKALCKKDFSTILYNFDCY